MILVISHEDGSFSINHQPERLGKTEEELLEMGVLLESEPVPDVIEGKDAILKFDGNVLYYEYVDRLLTTEEQLEQKDKQILELRQNLKLIDEVVTENGLIQQEILELLIEMGV